MSRIALVATLLLCLCLTACGESPPRLAGLDLGEQPAPDFRLTDAGGQAVTMSEWKGRPVLLTFLYTECPDVCPVIAQRVRQALESLGKDAGQVVVLAVSVDPEGDTPASAAAFMEKHGLTGPDQRYLIGEMAELAPVWLAYGVGAAPAATTQRPGEPVQLGRIGHTDASFLIDREGRKRRLLRGEATADEIARALKTLLR